MSIIHESVSCKQSKHAVSSVNPLFFFCLYCRSSKTSFHDFKQNEAHHLKSIFIPFSVRCLLSFVRRKLSERKSSLFVQRFCGRQDDILESNSATSSNYVTICNDDNKLNRLISRDHDWLTLIDFKTRSSFIRLICMTSFLRKCWKEMNISKSWKMEDFCSSNYTNFTFRLNILAFLKVFLKWTLFGRSVIELTGDKRNKYH